MKVPARHWAIAVCSLLSCAASGCAPLQTGGLGLFRGDEQQTPPYTGPMVTMSIQPEDSKAERVTIPIAPGMTIQTALEQQQLTERFNNMQIQVVRVTPQSNGRPVPLKAEYDPAHACVGILHDMALYPGDHIVVAEDTTTRLDQAVNRFTGIWGGR